MRKFELLLDPEAFFEYYYQYAVLNKPAEPNEIDLGKVFAQHQIILSPEISRQYRKYADENSRRMDYEFFKMWLSRRTDMNIENNVEIQEDDEQFDNFEEALVSRIKKGKLKAPVVLCKELSEKDYHKAKDIVIPAKLIPPHQLMSNEITNILARNTLEFKTSTDEGRDATPYREWFLEIMTGVEKIVIFDKFVYADNEFGPMDSFIYSQFPIGTTIDIYVDTHAKPEWSEEKRRREVTRKNSRFKYWAEKRSLQINIFDYDHQYGMSYHDRRIFFTNKKYALVPTQGYGSLPPTVNSPKVKKNSLMFSLVFLDWQKEVEKIKTTSPGYYLAWKFTGQTNAFSL